jgi:hypothetical protein
VLEGIWYAGRKTLLNQRHSLLDQLVASLTGQEDVLSFLKIYALVAKTLYCESFLKAPEEGRETKSITVVYSARES